MTRGAVSAAVRLAVAAPAAGLLAWMAREGTPLTVDGPGPAVYRPLTVVLAVVAGVAAAAAGYELLLEARTARRRRRRLAAYRAQQRADLEQLQQRAQRQLPAAPVRAALPPGPSTSGAPVKVRGGWIANGRGGVIHDPVPADVVERVATRTRQADDMQRTGGAR